MLCEKDLEECLKEFYRMPKTTDYSKCQIYKIVCKDPKIKDCYVGNTCNWIKRKSLHKHAVNHESNKGHNEKKAATIRNNGGWENWEMVLIENFPCENDLQARSKEREWLEKLGATMNSCSPIRSKEEKRIQHIEYNNINREIINKKNLERNGTKITCPCGVTLTLGNILKHRKSKKHIAWEKDQEFVDRLEKEMNEIIENN